MAPREVDMTGDPKDELAHLEGERRPPLRELDVRTCCLPIVQLVRVV